MTVPNDVITSRIECAACGHTASRTSEPWNNQYQCAEGCRCTMQGCCPGQEHREAR